MDVVLGWPHQVWKWIGQTNPDMWAAIAGWTTVVVAVVASIAAFKQVREARILREEQAQPYVVAYMEPSEVDHRFIDLVVKNFGTTVARDVRLVSSPNMQQAPHDGQAAVDLWIFENLPVLAPGQEWRTFWDSSITRKQSTLPARHEITITYKDSHNRPLPATHAILDWSAYSGRTWMVVYGQHHSAKALREIAGIMKKWSEFGGGVKVYSRDGDKKDVQKSEWAREQMRRHEDLTRRVLPQSKKAPAPDEAHDADDSRDSQVVDAEGVPE
ncbi:hypothetical protein [Micromonospora tulbaghiae]